MIDSIIENLHYSFENGKVHLFSNRKLVENKVILYHKKYVIELLCDEIYIYNVSEKLNMIERTKVLQDVFDVIFDHINEKKDLTEYKRFRGFVKLTKNLYMFTDKKREKT